MDKYTFKTDKLGKLEMKEIFFFFEEPLIFTCSDANGKYYLFSRLRKGEYAVASISEERLYFGKIRKVQVTTIFAEPESETYLLLGEPNVAKTIIEPKEIIADELLYRGVCLTV